MVDLPNGVALAGDAAEGVDVAMTSRAARPPRPYADLAMTKTLTFMVRYAGTTHRDFMDFWINEHAPYARQIPGMGGMIADEVIASDPGDQLAGLDPFALDGVAESFKPDWGRSPPPEMAEWTSDSPGRVGAALLHRVTETVVKQPHRGGRSLMLLLARKPDMTHEDFTTAWLAHAERARDIPEIGGLVVNEIFGTLSRTDAVVPLEGLGDNDLILQIWRDDGPVSTAAFTSPAAQAWVDEGLAIGSRNRGFMIREWVMIYPFVGPWKF